MTDEQAIWSMLNEPAPTGASEFMKEIILKSYNPVFLTGSRAYGTPREDSDWDWVVEVDLIMLGLCRAHYSRPSRDPDYPETSLSVREGANNFILVANPHHRRAWLIGTARCLERKPISRDEAVDIMLEVGVSKSLEPMEKAE